MWHGILCHMARNPLGIPSKTATSGRKSIMWVASTPGPDSEHYLHTIQNLVGQRSRLSGSALETVRLRIKAGFPKAAFDRVRSAMDLRTEKLSEVTDIPLRTLARRKKLRPDESDRLFRVASVLQRAVDTLEDIAAARKWLTSPKRALGNRSPIDVCDTEAGAHEVENLLVRIDQTVYS
jgi:putative toxin-antitoxin system antitoxin component (TIGR02293 family)